MPEIVGAQQIFVAFSSLLLLPSSLLKVMQMKSFCLIFRKYFFGACLRLKEAVPICLTRIHSMVVSRAHLCFWKWGKLLRWV